MFLFLCFWLWFYICSYLFLLTSRGQKLAFNFTVPQEMISLLYFELVSYFTRRIESAIQTAYQPVICHHQLSAVHCLWSKCQQQWDASSLPLPTACDSNTWNHYDTRWVTSWTLSPHKSFWLLVHARYDLSFVLQYVMILLEQPHPVSYPVRKAHCGALSTSTVNAKLPFTRYQRKCMCMSVNFIKIISCMCLCCCCNFPWLF